MCSNQLSYVAIFFRATFIGVAGRIMRIWPFCVNKFFPEKATGCVVCLGCEQYGDKITNSDN
jgi:hypothetical protein